MSQRAPAKEKPTGTIIRVDPDVYRIILAHKSEMELQQQRVVSLNEALRDMLKELDEERG